MKITYGIVDNNIDVTNICFDKLLNNGVIFIPSNDLARAKLFTDPLPNILKKIFILKDDILSEYEYYYTIKIDIVNNNITNINDNDIEDKLKNIHSKLNIKHGSLMDEYPEQKMVVRYFTGQEKVLEIGGNIGRNSLIIASILKNNNLVTLECDTDIANKLKENRDLNNFNFYIESSALSKRNLIQKEWTTIVSDTLQDGYKWVNTITFDELKNKYEIEFDTLVLDCEGAFYYILMDMPEMLDNINTIIMENDYLDISNKEYIDGVLKNSGFYRDYYQRGGWGPCRDNFFEVWLKK